MLKNCRENEQTKSATLFCPHLFVVLELDFPTTVLVYYILPVFKGSAVRTKLGSGCLLHTSHKGNRTRNLGDLSNGNLSFYQYLLQQKFPLCFLDIIYNEIRVLQKFCPVQDSNPGPHWPQLYFTCKGYCNTIHLFKLGNVSPQK